MLDLVLLRLMKYRKDFNQLFGIIPRDTKAVDDKTLAILTDFGRYYEAYPSHDRIDLPTFLPRFRAWHPTLNDEQYGGFERTLVAVAKVDADDDQKRNIINWLADVEMMTKAANLIEDFNNGDLADALSEMGALHDLHRRRTGTKFTGWIDTPISVLLQDEFDDSGVAWRLECLNRSMRKLRPGDFGIIAGRPDKGKTSFIASEATYMAPQLPPDRNVVWLNNEGPGKRIIPRVYQAALGLSMMQMKEMSLAGTLVPAYEEYMGRIDKVRVLDIHGMTNGQVELLIEDNSAGIVVFDMIDNIRGFGDAARTDLALEQMYQWARERMVKHDGIGMATSQISNDGDGLQFPTLGMLKDSKTGKQGACDFQLMIGAVNDPGFGNSRFISLPKNKLRRPDGPSDPRAEVIFDGLRSIYKDIPTDAVLETQHSQASLDELEGVAA